MMEEFGTRKAHAAQWETLAKGIAALKESVGETPAPSATPGELTIIGSGIETVGFTVGDEALLKSADHVFYCVADPATVVWLRRLRPDAMDLYVLYDDHKVRYTTYMQMAEAQLYWVRQGRKVVVVFYGHPGVFVLSTHRAVKIARREGHRAVMKAGICALDCLCADLGVDPCQPGLQTHEATDLLLRNMEPDPRLHVVLWQVGLIGEMGFRRQGFLNTNFSLFVSYLQRFYGPDYPVTHYVASRYPTISPLIDVIPLSRLHDPDIQKTITGLSTFYLAPKDVSRVDEVMARELGILSAGQSAAVPKQPLRDIVRYGPRERLAFTDFSTFTVPVGYHWQEETAASRFLIALRFDPDLQTRYAKDPAQALADPRFVDLTQRERALLLSRDSGAIQVAAKGIGDKKSSNYTLLMKFFNNKNAALAVVSRLRDSTHRQAREALSRWAENEGTPIVWDRMAEDLMAIHRNCLFPWTGAYVSNGASLLTILADRGSPKNAVILIDDTPLRVFRYDHGNLSWSVSGGNPHNGFVRFDIDAKGFRQIIGKIWDNDAAIPEKNNIQATELDPERGALRTRALLTDKLRLPDLTGSFLFRLSDGRRIPATIDGDIMSINGITVNNVQFIRGTLSWSGGPAEASAGALRIIVDPLTLAPELFGNVSSVAQDNLSCFGSGLFELADPEQGAAPFDSLSSSSDIWRRLADISRAHRTEGGLLLWHKWEKHAFTSAVVNRALANLL